MSHVGCECIILNYSIFVCQVWATVILLTDYSVFVCQVWANAAMVVFMTY